MPDQGLVEFSNEINFALQEAIDVIMILSLLFH